MISDERLAEMVMTIRRSVQHDERPYDSCPGCLADLALDELRSSLRADPERVAVLEGALEHVLREGCVGPKTRKRLRDALTPDPEPS